MQQENLVKELPEFLSDLYKKKLTLVKCPTCENILQNGRIFCYEHNEGWLVPGFEKKQWLFTECPKCKYQISLLSLGINKDFHIDSIQYEKAKGKYYRDMVYCPECKKAIEISNTDKYECLRNHTSIFHPFLFSD